ncbi:ABC transporter permease [Pseudochelatococcus sp. B33]
MSTVPSSSSPSRGPALASTLRDTYFSLERGILGGLAIIVFLLLWEGISRGWWAAILQPFIGDAADILRIRPIFLPAPSVILSLGWELYFVTGEMWRHLGLSAFQFVCGFLIAATLGITIGLVSGRYRLLSYAVEPLLTALNAMPQVALVPLVVLWMGTDVPARIFIITLLMIVPILINAHAAVRTIEPRWLKLAKSFSASEVRVLLTIVLPASVPFLLAATRIAIGRGMIGIVVGEIYGAPIGIGVTINHAGSTFETAKVFVGIITIVVFGLVLSEIVRRVERRVEAWRPAAFEQS